MLLGLLSRKVTNLSAIVGFLCGLATALALFVCLYGIKLGSTAPGVAEAKEEVSAPAPGELKKEGWLRIGPFVPDDNETPLFAGVVWNPQKNEIVLGTLQLKMEVVLFACNALVTLLATLVVMLIKPMGAEEQKRVDAFRDRLHTPIGQLEEDRLQDTSGTAIVSPFRVVGISTVLIGLMMLAILPWIWRSADRLAFGLDAFLGTVLVVIGVLTAKASATNNPQETAIDGPADSHHGASQSDETTE
jgi:hypothetical protein